MGWRDLLVQGRLAGYRSQLIRSLGPSLGAKPPQSEGVGCCRPSLKDSEMPGFLETLPELSPTPTLSTLLCGVGTAQGAAGLASLPLLSWPSSWFLGRGD